MYKAYMNDNLLGKSDDHETIMEIVNKEAYNYIETLILAGINFNTSFRQDTVTILTMGEELESKFYAVDEELAMEKPMDLVDFRACRMLTTCGESDIDGFGFWDAETRIFEYPGGLFIRINDSGPGSDTYTVIIEASQFDSYMVTDLEWELYKFYKSQFKGS